MTTKTAVRTQVDEKLRENWMETIIKLTDQINAWSSQKPGWEFKPQEDQEIEEALLGKYRISTWKLETPDGQVRVEPIARNYPGAGLVELYAWPTLYRVRLVQNSEWGGWRVRTDSGIFLRQQWDRENFITLIDDLIAADA